MPEKSDANSWSVKILRFGAVAMALCLVLGYASYRQWSLHHAASAKPASDETTPQATVTPTSDFSNAEKDSYYKAPRFIHKNVSSAEDDDFLKGFPLIYDTDIVIMSGSKSGPVFRPSFRPPPESVKSDPNPSAASDTATQETLKAP